VVHTSNNVEATFDFIEATFDFVAFDNVASTLLLVWTVFRMLHFRGNTTTNTEQEALFRIGLTFRQI